MSGNVVICGRVLCSLRSLRTNDISRFSKQEIRQILPFLNLDSVLWTNQYQPSSELALCLVLTRLSFPQRLFQLSDLFGRSEPTYRQFIMTLLIIYVVDIEPCFDGTPAFSINVYDSMLKQ